MYSMSDVYTHLLTWLLSAACPEQRNRRTGHGVKVGRGGTSFRIDLADRVLPTVGSRRLFPKSAAAETAWYLSGEKDVTWLRRYAPLWDKFVEDDGKTIQSAYGYRWRKYFGRDQVTAALLALLNDPSDRRVLISAWDPAADGLGMPNQKNVPCPFAFNLYLLEGELHSTLHLRSSDVFVGLPYDVMGHAFLMDAFATSLGAKLGVMQVSLAHPHLYEDHYLDARTCLAIPEEKRVVPEMPLPGWGIEHILADRDAYVVSVGNEARRHEWPLFSPKPLVVE